MVDPRNKPEGSWKILLALDGSEHSLAALSLVSDLPLTAEISVTTLGVFLPRNASEYYAYETILQQAGEKLAQQGIQVQSELLAGYPAQIIHQVAEEKHPDLIVLGAKGRRATMGINLGGVAQQVVEYSDSPVLVVRAPYSGLERILLVSDGSPISECALEYLSRLPLPKNAAIDVVHVLPPIPLPQPVVATPVWSIGYERGTLVEMQTEEEMQAILAEEKKDGEAILKHTCEHLSQLFAAEGRVISITSALLQGDAATEIIEFAAKKQTNLIVAGSRGLSPVKSWLLGSVSRKLLHYAPCSVLVVRCLPH